jgi:hypothetical protein
MNYERTLSKIEEIRDQAKDHVDTDYINHVDELAKNHLKKTEWKLEPLENPENNFFEPLLVKYLDDLDIRH